MLSPHDIATLMVIQAGGTDVALLRHEIVALQERDLIIFDELGVRPGYPRLTHLGAALLSAIGYRYCRIMPISCGADMSAPR
jgi:hypothetical protein